MLPWAERGRKFEDDERAAWEFAGEYTGKLGNQFPIEFANGRKGRIDIVAHQDNETEVVIEQKATDWDAMADYRIRPNVLRHIRQLMRYAYHFVDQGVGVHPALVYRPSPSSAERKQKIEEIGLEACVEVVWRDELPTQPADLSRRKM